MNAARILLWNKQRNLLQPKNKYCCTPCKSNQILDRICAYKKKCVVVRSTNVSKFHSIEVNVLSNPSDSIRFECICILNACACPCTQISFHPTIFYVVTRSTAQHSTHSHMTFTTAYYPLCSSMLAMQFLALCNSSSIHFRLMVYQKWISFVCDTNILVRKLQFGQVPSNLLGQDEEVF